MQPIILASKFTALSILEEEREILENAVNTEVEVGTKGDNIDKGTLKEIRVEKKIVRGGRPKCLVTSSVFKDWSGYVSWRRKRFKKHPLFSKFGHTWQIMSSIHWAVFGYFGDQPCV